MDQDLDELRRRAFSRQGTADDLRLLAEAEAPPTEEMPPVRDDPDARADATDDPAAPAIAPPAPSRGGGRGRIILAAALGAAAGLLLGAGAANLLTETPEDPNSSLLVFDRPETAIPDGVPLPPDFFPADSEVRYLGQVDGRFVYAARSVGTTDSQVCISVAEADMAGGGCTTEDDFRRRGIQVFSGDSGVGWGPVGQELWTSTLAD